MTFWDLIGSTGGIIVSYSNVPQLIMFVRQGHAEGISKSSTWIGTFGLLFRMFYLMHTTNANYIVLGPYFFAIFCCILTLYYCHFPRKESK